MPAITSREKTVAAENKRFLLLIGGIIIVVVMLSVVARLLGSVLWSQVSESRETTLFIPADEIESFPDIPANAAQTAEPDLPKAPVHITVKGRAPPEFLSLEGELLAAGEELFQHAADQQALKKKAAETDALISQAEGISTHKDAPSPVSSLMPEEWVSGDEGSVRNDNIERLRERLDQLKGRL